VAGTRRGNGGDEATTKIRVGVIFGGRSGEHEVSLMSARSVIAALDPERFEVVPLGITREGRWLLPHDAAAALRGGPASAEGVPVVMVPGAERSLVPAGGGDASPPILGRLDVVFPVVHGPNGEDGTLQGLLELCGLPYVGAGVLGSALGMDKISQKDLLARHGLPVTDYVPVLRHEWLADPEGTVEDLLARLGLPCFVKPSNLGSSVGISKARTRAELTRGLAEAARLDRRLLCERAVADCREIECGVLGNEYPEASVPGEVIPLRDFYDYEAKYVDAGADLVVPADLPPSVAADVRQMALRAFRVLDCAGMARVDFFVERGSHRVLVNEVNTIPGFTATSMYPRLWEASGVPYRALLGRLVDLALDRHAAQAGRSGG